MKGPRRGYNGVLKELQVKDLKFLTLQVGNLAFGAPNTSIKGLGFQPKLVFRVARV